jgi:hypothetical protein
MFEWITEWNKDKNNEMFNTEFKEKVFSFCSSDVRAKEP